MKFLDFVKEFEVGQGGSHNPFNKKLILLTFGRFIYYVSYFLIFKKVASYNYMSSFRS